MSCVVLLQRVLAAAAACSSAPAVASTSARSLGVWASRQEWGAQTPATLRAVHSTPQAAHQHGKDDEGAEKITVTFVEEKTGKEFSVQAPVGKSLMEVAHDNEIELEGACEGSLACSTCHVVVEDEDLFNKLPEATEDELDMLDLAFGLTETSRLGCQVIAAKELEGLRVRIPSATRNMYVDGHVPKPH